METFKKYVNNLLFAFKKALEKGSSDVIKYLVFYVISSVIGFVLDVYYLAYVIKMLVAGAPWESVLKICILGAVFVFINIVFAKYSEVQELIYSMKIKECVEMDIFKKNLDFTLSECINKDFYDEFSFVLNNAPNQIINSVQIIAKIITSLFYSVFFIIEMLNQNVIIILLITLLLLFHILIKKKISTKKSMITYSNSLEMQPLLRYNNYFTRLFYLKKYSYDLKNEKIYNIILEKYNEGTENYIKEHMKAVKKEVVVDIFNTIYDSIFMTLVVPILLIFSLKAVGTEDISVYWQLNALVTKIASLYLFSMIADLVVLSNHIQKMREFFSKKTEKVLDKKKLLLPPSVLIKDINFSYDEKMAFSLKNINMRIDKGEKIAIVGRNGSGKTTLLNLILGLYLPQKGTILLDDQSIENYDLDGHSLCLMSQNFNLYSTTLKNNINMGNFKYTEEEIQQAAHLADCNDFIEKLPLGLDSTLGRDIYENAIELSGGEAQKIALARVFLSNANLIIMDEPTAAVESLSGVSTIKRLLEKFSNKTVIMVTHRLDITKFADKIYVMENGEIVENGSFQELLDKKTLFYDMYKYQIGE